jgi:glycosyltransferase involved in cell wall biosynthesis
MQETTFPVEILVHDDASTDGTAEIIREYAEAFPQLIKPILQTKNQYSQGKFVAANNYCRARGHYVAICEGDDYWCDPRKLQKQTVALENNPDIDLSIHSAYKIHYKTGMKSVIGRYRTESGIVPVGSVITKAQGVIPTASSFLRRSVLSEITEFRNARPYLTIGDIYVHFFGSVRGGAYYINEPMSIYRSNVPGSWNERVLVNAEMRLRHASARLRSYSELDRRTGRKYSAYFMQENRSWARRIIRDKQFGFPVKMRFFLRNMQYLRFQDALRLGVLVFS